MSWPIGNTLTLTRGTLSVQLNERELYADGAAGTFGYQRVKNSELSPKGEQILRGTVQVTGPQFVPGYEFQISALVNAAKMHTLTAILDSQQRAIAERSSDISVLLIDQRFALLEPAPRTRAKIGPLVSGAPTGYELFWPKFSVLLNQLEPWAVWGYPQGVPLFKIELTAVELDRVPPAQDS